MIKTEDLTHGVLVQTIMPMKLSQNRHWQSPVGHLIDNQIKYAIFYKFHSGEQEAAQIMYRHSGKKFQTYVHYKDLIKIDEIPGLKKEVVLFDENNLDV